MFAAGAPKKANITLIISSETYDLIEAYLNTIKKQGMEALVRQKKMGNRLYTVLSNSNIQKLTTLEFFDALLKTGHPDLFNTKYLNENNKKLSPIKGDGSDWTRDEMTLLTAIVSDSVNDQGGPSSFEEFYEQYKKTQGRVSFEDVQVYHSSNPDDFETLPVKKENSQYQPKTLDLPYPSFSEKEIEYGFFSPFSIPVTPTQGEKTTVILLDIDSTLVAGSNPFSGQGSRQSSKPDWHYNESLINALKQECAGRQDIIIDLFSNMNFTTAQMVERLILIEHLRSQGLPVRALITPQDLGVAVNEKLGNPLGAAFNYMEKEFTRLVQEEANKYRVSVEAVYKKIFNCGLNLIPEATAKIAREWDEKARAIKDGMIGKEGFMIENNEPAIGNKAPMLLLFLKHMSQGVQDIIVFDDDKKLNLRDVELVAKKNPHVTITTVQVDKEFGSQLDRKEKDDAGARTTYNDSHGYRYSQAIQAISDRRQKVEEDRKKRIIAKLTEDGNKAVTIDQAVQNRIKDYLVSNVDKNFASLRIAVLIQEIQKLIDHGLKPTATMLYQSPQGKIRALKILQEHLILSDLGLIKEKSIPKIIENWLNAGISVNNKGEMRTAREILGEQRHALSFKGQGKTQTLKTVYSILQFEREQEKELQMAHNTVLGGLNIDLQNHPKGR